MKIYVSLTVMVHLFLALGSLVLTPRTDAHSAERKPSVRSVPPHSEFTPPPPNACASKYDQFYGSEPGVYAYWALCERGQDPAIHDYVGSFDFDSMHCTWATKGTIGGGTPGPLSDNETAVEVSAKGFGLKAAQNLPVNRNEGTIAAWINSRMLPHDS